MNLDKLAELRRIYGSDTEIGIFDPHFAEVARQVGTGRKRRWPFAGIPTLLDAAPLDPDAGALAPGALDIALIGVPMDLGVTNRGGARFGPRAVRAMERIGPYEHVLKLVPAAAAKLADIGDVPMRSRYSLESCHQDIEAFYRRIADAGVIPLSVGGDHSVTYPILKALGRDRPVGLVHIDAHCDTGGPFEDSKFHHGGPFRQAVLDGVLDPERTIQIGIRGPAEYLWEFSYASGMTVIHAETMAAMGIDAVIAKAKAVVGSGPVYLSFDVDGLDPVYAPGTGTPEIGGLSTREVLQIFRGLTELDVIGGDVVEIAPQYDATTNTAQAGAQVLFEMLCLAVLAFQRRRGATASA